MVIIRYIVFCDCFCDRKSKHLQQDMHAVTTRLKTMTATVEKVGLLMSSCQVCQWTIDVLKFCLVLLVLTLSGPVMSNGYS